MFADGVGQFCLQTTLVLLKISLILVKLVQAFLFLRVARLGADVGHARRKVGPGYAPGHVFEAGAFGQVAAERARAGTKHTEREDRRR